MKIKQRIPNAEKWSLHIVWNVLGLIKEDAENGKIYYIGMALARRGGYKQLWKYWKKKFRNNEDITERMLMIESIIEAKLVQAVMDKKVPAGIAMFILKHKYGWNESELDEPVDLAPHEDDETAGCNLSGEVGKPREFMPGVTTSFTGVEIIRFPDDEYDYKADINVKT